MTNKGEDSPKRGGHWKHLVVLVGVCVPAVGIVLAVWLVLSSSGSDMHEGFLYRFRDGELWGYIDDEGDVVVPPTYKEAYGFSEGLAMVRADDMKFGFIDVSGRYAIPPAFKWVQGFNDGLARATTTDGRHGFIDHRGKMVFEIDSHDRCYRFSEGLAFIGRPMRSVGGPNSPRRYGYLNTSGKLVIPHRFDQARDFYNGHAAVCVGKKWGLIDTKGNLVMKPAYDGIETRPFCGYEDGLIPVRQKGLWGAADITGKLVIEAKYKELGAFREGLACARDSAGKYGYIDTKGDWAIRPQFGWASEFHNGRAAVWEPSSHIGLIDTKGQTVSTIPFTVKLMGFGPASHGAWSLTGAGVYLVLRSDGKILWPKEQ